MLRVRRASICLWPAFGDLSGRKLLSCARPNGREGGRTREGEFPRERRFERAFALTSPQAAASPAAANLAARRRVRRQGGRLFVTRVGIKLAPPPRKRRPRAAALFLRRRSRCFCRRRRSRRRCSGRGGGGEMPRARPAKNNDAPTSRRSGRRRRRRRCRRTSTASCTSARLDSKSRDFLSSLGAHRECIVERAPSLPPRLFRRARAYARSSRRGGGGRQATRARNERLAPNSTRGRSLTSMRNV